MGNQSGCGGHCWRYTLPKPRVPTLLTRLHELVDHPHNPGPYFILETEYENLFLLSQEWGTPAAEKISSCESAVEDLKMLAPQLGRAPWDHLTGFLPLDPWRCLVSFHTDAPKRDIALHMRKLRGYTFQHVKTGLKLHWNGWSPPNSSKPAPITRAKPNRSDTTQTFVGWTAGAELQLVKLAVSLFGPWDNWCAQPEMFGDSLCQYASVIFQHLSSVGLAAGQYVDLGNGAYVHLTAHNENLDRSISKKVDKQLRHDFPPTDEALKQVGRSLGFLPPNPGWTETGGRVCRESMHRLGNTQMSIGTRYPPKYRCLGRFLRGQQPDHSRPGTDPPKETTAFNIPSA